MALPRDARIKDHASKADTYWEKKRSLQGN